MFLETQTLSEDVILKEKIDYFDQNLRCKD